MSEDEAIASLAETLLPGANGFPAASAIGLGPLLAERLRITDAALPMRLRDALAAQPVPPQSDWVEATRRLEATDPKSFDALRKYAYLTYYEQPSVIDAIHALGFRYNHAPLPEGYPDEPFDTATDAPTHRRGRWIATADVTRVDVASLDLERVR